mmetsp:Transcript_9534/g.14729  ORF Transcript_9534/g.14729 Transcript_9534/m.14729 type:complete len:327 (+) Transcript_9534:80-1060(+)
MPRSKTTYKKTKQETPFISKRDTKKDDILLGRGRLRFRNTGNVAYRALIESRLPVYFKASRKGKSLVVLEIIKSIKLYGSRFLKSKGSLWQEADLKIVREKVGHSIRDAVRTNVSFQYQETMRNIFDENSTYQEIFEYVVKNKNLITSEISTEEKKIPFAPIPGKAEAIISEDDVSDSEDTISTVISEEAAGSVRTLEDKEIKEEMPLLAPPLVRVRSSFVNSFVSKLTKEAAELADKHLLENRRAQADNFRIISLASIHDWVEFDTCSKHSDDQWSEHLLSLVSSDDNDECRDGIQGEMFRSDELKQPFPLLLLKDNDEMSCLDA